MLVYIRVLDEGAPEAFVLTEDSPTVADLLGQVMDTRSARSRLLELDLQGAVGDARLADLGVKDGDLLGVRASGEPVERVGTAQPPVIDLEGLQIEKRKGKRLSEYEEVTQLLQWHAPYHVNGDRDSHAVWTDDSTVLRCTDWEAYRSPDKLYYRTYTTRQARAGRSVATAFDFAERERQLETVDPARVQMMREVVGALQYPDWGLCVVHQHNTRFALSSWIAGATSFMMFDELRHAQMYGRLALAYAEHHEGFEDPSPAWMESARFQPTRRLIEELMATLDWGKAIVVAHLLVEPLHTAAARALLTTHSLQAGDALSPFVCRSIEDDKIRHRESAVAFLQMVCEDEGFGPSNRELVSSWAEDFLPRAFDAARTLIGSDVDDLSPLDEAIRWIREEFAEVGVDVVDPRQVEEVIK